MVEDGRIWKKMEEYGRRCWKKSEKKFKNKMFESCWGCFGDLSQVRNDPTKMIPRWLRPKNQTFQIRIQNDF